MKTQFLKTKQDITAWLDRYGVENYTLVVDSIYGFVVNVVGDVLLCDKNLRKIPVKFNVAAASFYCQNNQLSSLEFCPVIVAGYFDCTYNQLNSLDFCPTAVGGRFFCYNNPALGNTQSIYNFSDILKIHQEIVHIKKEKDSLEKQFRTANSMKNLANKNTLKI